MTREAELAWAMRGTDRGGYHDDLGTLDKIVELRMSSRSAPPELGDVASDMQRQADRLSHELSWAKGIYRQVLEWADEQGAVRNLWNRVARFSDMQRRVNVFTLEAKRQGLISEQEYDSLPLRPPTHQPTVDFYQQQAEKSEALQQAKDAILSEVKDKDAAIALYNRMGGHLSRSRLRTWVSWLVSEGLLEPSWRRKVESLLQKMLDIVRPNKALNPTWENKSNG
jgi:hypothetical protein